MTDRLAGRRAGVLLHITSLPGPETSGTLGNDAYRFVDFLAAAGFGVWQILPLGPTDEYGSPYCVRSAFAGNPALLDSAALRELEALPSDMDFAAVRDAPEAAYVSYLRSCEATQYRQFVDFVQKQRSWLGPHAIYAVCSDRFAAPWWEWPEGLRHPTAAAVRQVRATASPELRATMFQQYLFALQWDRLKRYANARGVQLFGDLPFYVDHNSVDVWWNQAWFELNGNGQPRHVAGVPPDYFSSDGQLWGNPLYAVEAMASSGFSWWLARLASQLERFDMLRIDHFRALESYWAVAAGASTARDGSWRQGFGAPLLEAFQARHGPAALVAEDLGLITDEVRALRDRFGLPGMAVLQFAFDGSPDNPHLPANCGRRVVMYTGTHDNDTTVGWYSGLEQATRDLVAETLHVAHIEVPETFLEAVYACDAQLAMIPMQDLLGLGREARMNTPGTLGNNWQWRFSWKQLDPAHAERAMARAERHSRRAPTDGSLV